MPASPERLYVNDSGNTEKEQKTIEHISSELQKIEAQEAVLFRYAENETDPTKRQELKKQYIDLIERNKKKRAQLDQLAKQTFTRDTTWKAPTTSHSAVSDLPEQEESSPEVEEVEPAVAPGAVDVENVAAPEEEVEEENTSLESVDELLLLCDKQVSALNDFFSKRKAEKLPEIHDPEVMKQIRKIMETIHYKERPAGVAEALEEVSELVSKLFAEGEAVPFDGAENIEEIYQEVLMFGTVASALGGQVSANTGQIEQNFTKAQDILAERVVLNA